MDRVTWRQTIESLPVFDTHTHLNRPGVPIAARNFWDIAHYFWFLQELWSVGYPLDADDLPEQARIERFCQALDASRNTVWNQIVRRVFRNLYEIELEDAASVRQADEAVRGSFANPDWPREVIDRLNIRCIAVNVSDEADYPGLLGVGIKVPSHTELPWTAWTVWIDQAADQHAAGEAVAAEMQASVSERYDQGVRGMRVGIEALQRLGQVGIAMSDHLPTGGASNDEIEAFLTHALFYALGEHGMFAQFFLGIQQVSPRTSMAVNDPQYIPMLYPLFEQYACDFELVIGAPQMNLDAAQAARIYPNVHVGGLWWYNFRSSTYRQAMQVRLEAVPASKSAIVASDARCIEWCYAKILLIKRLLADFTYDQIAGGWLNETDALWVAREWLYHAAARRYLPG